jgi:hypothetical protein
MGEVFVVVAPFGEWGAGRTLSVDKLDNRDDGALVRAAEDALCGPDQDDAEPHLQRSGWNEADEQATDDRANHGSDSHRRNRCAQRLAVAVSAPTCVAADAGQYCRQADKQGCGPSRFDTRLASPASSALNGSSI